MKPAKSKPQISDNEFKQWIGFESAVIDASTRKATLLKIGEPISSSAEADSFFGYINTLPADTAWPMQDDEPMLPLLQINLSQVPHRPPQLNDFDFLLVFCGIDASPDMPTGLLSELFEICQKPNHDDQVKAFYTRNASRIKTTCSPDPEQIQVMTVARGATSKSVSSRDTHPILKPHRIVFEPIHDTVDDSGTHYKQFLATEDAILAEELLRNREHTEDQFNTYLGLFKNTNGSKLGGWPSCIQDYVDFDGEADFVLQIASDTQIGLMLLDSGSIYIGYNSKKNAWESDWACY